MELITNAKEVAMRAWSVRLAILSAVLSAAELTLPMFSTLVPPNLMAALSMAVAIGAAAARVIAQPTTLPKS